MYKIALHVSLSVLLIEFKPALRMGKARAGAIKTGQGEASAPSQE